MREHAFPASPTRATAYPPCTACLRSSRFSPSAAGLRADPAPPRTYSEQCWSVKTDLVFLAPKLGGLAIGAFSAPSPPQGAAPVGGSRARWSISSLRSGQARRALAKNAQRETGFAWAGDARNPPVSFMVGRPSAAHGEPVRDEIRPGRGARKESAGRRRRQPTQDEEAVWCYEALALAALLLGGRRASANPPLHFGDSSLALDSAGRAPPVLGQRGLRTTASSASLAAFIPRESPTGLRRES
jgi:hypothetical protein